MRNAEWFRHAAKVIAVAASSGAALVSVFTALYSYGVLGETEAHQSIGNIGAAWVGLRPGADTASAIGDTVHYAATVTDAHGSILVGARPTWTIGDSTIGKVLTDGSVIARAPGRTTVSVVVGKRIATSRFVVHQRVASVEVMHPTVDSTISIPEGAQVLLHARAMDSRGHDIAGQIATWRSDDTTVASLDTTGVIIARNAGKTVVTARIDGVSGRSRVSVVTPATSLALVAGTDQSAVAGLALPQAIVVRATNRRGGPASNKLVEFRLSENQGKVQPVSVHTDADGRARAVWTLGSYPGRQTLLASVENVDSALAIVAEAEPVAADTRIAPLAGTVVGRAGENLPDDVGIRVTDSSGRVLSDIPVRWTVVDGGTAEGLSARTDSLGIARARWTLGAKTGIQRIRAHVGNGPGSRSIVPVTITASALAGAPAALLVESGDNQKGTAGEKLRKPIVVKLVDANGSGVSDAALDLSPSSGLASDSVIRTDSVGRARISWTMGRSAGAHSLAVRVDGVKKVLKITAEARAGRPANLSFDDVIRHAKANRSAERTKRLYAVVTDLYGNPVPDARVSFTASSGTVDPKRVVSDAKGRAELAWKIGIKPGEQVLLGRVAATDVKGDYRVEIVAPAVPKPRSVNAKQNGKQAFRARSEVAQTSK